MTANLSLNARYSLTLTCIFAYCTPAWSTVSRALWQHGPSMLLLSIALYLLVRDKPEKRVCVASLGFLLFFAYAVRPTNVASLLLFSAYVALFRTRAFPWLLLGESIAAAVFFYSNLSIYGHLLPPVSLPTAYPWDRISLRHSAARW